MLKYFLSSLLLLNTILFSLQTRASDTDIAQELKKNVNHGEILILNSETKAIDNLEKLLKKYKGSEQEADLSLRLADLYIKKSKTIKFFELQMNQSKQIGSSKDLQKAIKILNQIESKFKNYSRMDEVYFNTGHLYQILGNTTLAYNYYKKISTNKPNSMYVPDSELAMGEIKFEQQDFVTSISHFKRVEEFPNSKSYPYAIYKHAWALYNKRENNQAIEKMKLLVDLFKDKENLGHNLRIEGLRDLGIFFSDTYSSKDAYTYFNKLTNKSELGPSLISLAKIYSAHSKFKDQINILTDYTDNEEINENTIQAHIYLAETYEVLKERENSISQLEHLYKKCKLLTEKKVVSDLCNKDVRHVTLELAQKWWDLWLKNKAHYNKSDEVANWSLSAFKLEIESKPYESTDSKIHFAYAELHYQLKIYNVAQKHYLLANSLTTDMQLKHDSLYAALLCSEFLKSTDNVILLSYKYIESFPKGEHNENIKINLAITLLSNNDNLENKKQAFKISKELAFKCITQENCIKAQDISISILEQDKKYFEIEKLIPDLYKYSKNNERIQFIDKLSDKTKLLILNEKTEQLSKSDLMKEYLKLSKEIHSPDFKTEIQWNALVIASQISQPEFVYQMTQEICAQNAKQCLDSNKELLKWGTYLGKFDWVKNSLTYLANSKDKDNSFYKTTLTNLEQILISNKPNIKHESLSKKDAYSWAKVLENEYYSQSLKTQDIQRLELLLTYKLEKLDKAISAFNTAIKLIQDIEIKLQSLRKMSLMYEHLLSALSTNSLFQTYPQKMEIVEALSKKYTEYNSQLPPLPPTDYKQKYFLTIANTASQNEKSTGNTIHLNSLSTSNTALINNSSEFDKYILSINADAIASKYVRAYYGAILHINQPTLALWFLDSISLDNLENDMPNNLDIKNIVKSFNEIHMILNQKMNRPETAGLFYKKVIEEHTLAKTK